MTQNQDKQAGQGKAFFDRADQVADTGNWDYAIEMYLNGISREPTNMERGHRKLREVAMKRTATGGKKPGMMEQIKRLASKDPTTGLVNAEYLLAKEPGSVKYMSQTLKAARRLDIHELIKWICDILLESQRQTDKPDKDLYKTLIASYRSIEDYSFAVECCKRALEISPDDGALSDELMDLSARDTIHKGKYDQEGEFQRSMKDVDKQIELGQADSMVKSDDYLQKQIERAKIEYEADSAVPGKILSYAEALLKFEDESHEAQASEVLKKAHTDTGQYQFAQKIGDIKIRQLTRKYRELVAAGDKEAIAAHARKQLQFELAHYKERAENYPTDLALKYELGRRQFLAGQYDDAIGSLQRAQSEPRRRIQAISYLGQSFAKKGWLSEAVETFRRAIDKDLPEERIKDLRYHLGEVLAKMGELQEAKDQFSIVAQIDFNFREVRKKLDDLRKKIAESEQSGE